VTFLSTFSLPAFSAGFDCRTCGACCASPWDGHGYVTLSPAEVPSVRAAGAITVTLRNGGESEAGELVEKLSTRLDRAGRFVCAQLDGEPGGACGCRIYESRPGPCRELEPGSAGCLDARRGLGLDL